MKNTNRPNCSTTSTWSTSILLFGAILSIDALGIGSLRAEQGEFLSHPPVRPLPALEDRPLANGPGFFVDAAAGKDENPGSQQRPWRTINHALAQLSPGDTLYLRGGTYFENVYCAVVGTADAPITIRGYPGERVFIDGGIPEFQNNPAESWKPLPDGAEGEYISAQPYKNIRDVLGLFADSDVGLQTYWHVEDLRAASEYWEVDPETKVVQPVYCGPGLWYDKQSGHIHARLAHSHIENPEVANYQGETDPRKLPLVIAPFGSVPLVVDQAVHVRFEDLVIRGGGMNSVVLQFGVDLTFDNVVVFGGTYCLRSRSTGPLRITNCGLHGMIPPWAFRTENSLYTYTPDYYDPFWKQPDTPGRNVARLPTHAVLVTEGSYEFEVFYYPHNHDWDISNSEFTDGHDGVYLSGRNIRFHHNRVDNIQDDAVYLSSPVPYFSDNIHIYQNLITRALMAFGCHSRGVRRGNIYIYRNVADLRKGVNAARPTSTNPQGGLTSYHIFLMHGREQLGVESLNFYQNTFISNAHAGGFAHRTLTNTSARTSRRVFNNIFIYLNGFGGLPASHDPPHDIQCDGNLHWCVNPEAKIPPQYLENVQQSKGSEQNRTNYPPGWAANSVVADPKFTSFRLAGEHEYDYRLQSDSPAIGQGVALPAEWNDPLRPRDGARPDIGALPHGSNPFQAGRVR